MAVKVLEATPGVIDTLQKAKVIVNQSQEPFQKLQRKDSRLEFQNLNYSTNLVAAKIVSGTGITGYLCDIYENGLGESPTSQGTVFLPNGASSLYILPVRNNHICAKNAFTNFRRLKLC